MNLASVLIHASKHVAIRDGSDVFSFKDLGDKSLRLCASLIAAENITPGDRVVILGHNSAEFVVSYLAVLSSGAVVVPLDPISKEAEMARDISLVDPKLIITSTSSWIPEALREKVSVIEFNSTKWRKYLKSKPAKIVERNENDIALMMMTAGASFQPKPAMLSHKSLVSNLEQANKVDELRLNQKDIVLGALPMYHIFGLHVVLGFALYCQSQVVITRSFDALELANVIKNSKVSVVPAIPAVFEAFLRDELVTIDYLNEVRMFISGGAPMRNEVRELFKKKFGNNVSEGYGITEAGPMISFAADPNVEGELGKALPGIDIQIRDSSGSVAIEGDVGQIVVKGDNVFSGYYNDSASTKKVLDDNGWLYTGDIGVADSNGTVILIDRSSDVIVVSGFSVFPSEVESALLKHDLVKAVSVVGELDTDTGETPVSFIVLDIEPSEIADPKSKRVLEKTLRDHCSTLLARYKIPSKFKFVDELSIKASGRPLRKSLRSAMSNFDDI